MKNMRISDIYRLFMSFCVVILAVLFLTACGSGNSAENTDPTPEISQAPAGVTRGELTLTPTPGVDPTTDPAQITSPSPTADLTEVPTAEPTVEPTASPAPTPLPVLSEEPAEYGDLTEYFNETASGVIGEFDRPYRYEYWGPDHENEAYGGFTFDEKVYFAFEYNYENLNASQEVDTIIIRNDKEKPLDAGIGGGLNMGMKYSEIKSVMGDVLHGPVANDDGTRYEAYGYYEYHHYYFTWSLSPSDHDEPADFVIIYDRYPQTRADVETYVLRKAVKEYLNENEKVLRDHKEQFLKDLRKVYKYEPVCKYNLLATIRADGHNTVEVCELAMYGCPPAYEATHTGYGGIEFAFSGVDRTKELYRYCVTLRLLTDGQSIDSCVYIYESECDEGYIFSTDTIGGGITWNDSYASEANALREMIGIEGRQKELMITSASTRRPVSEPNYYYSENIVSYYLNGGTTPILTMTYNAYESNDGGIEKESLKTGDGKDLLHGLEQVKEGTGTIGGHKVTWSLCNSSDGLQVLYTVTEEDVGCTYKEYILLDDCLILYYSMFEL